MHMSPAQREVVNALTVAGHMVEFEVGNPTPWVALDDRGSRAWVERYGTGYRVWAEMTADYFCPHWPTVIQTLHALIDAR